MIKSFNLDGFWIAVFIFEIKDAKKNWIFFFFKEPFLRNGYDFWRVSRDQCEAFKKYNFEIFLKI